MLSSAARFPAFIFIPVMLGACAQVKDQPADTPYDPSPYDTEVEDITVTDGEEDLQQEEFEFS